VESDGLHHGASFTVILPVGDLSSSATVARPAVATAPSIGLRVLIVEDDEDSAVTLATVLTDRGCQVRIARSAHECFDVLEHWHPDLLLCDIGLPDEDGYSLLRHVRERFADVEHVPAIALTAFTRQGDQARALRAGFAAHVSKPFEPEHLLDEIVHAVAGAQ